MFDISGKKVFVTGGSSGIGLAVTEHFLTAGADVVVADLRCSDDLARTRAQFLPVDVSDQAQMQEAFGLAAEALGELDVVINNAGIALPEGPIVEADLSTLERVFSVNVKGVYLGLKYAPANMRDGGSIINTASAAAHLTMPEYTAYGLSKASVLSMTRNAALQLGSRGIRVNAISPGTITTPMEPADSVESRLCAKATALGRTGSTDDLVGAFHFLASDASRYITGTDLQVDGGWIAGMTYQTLDKLLS